MRIAQITVLGLFGTFDHVIPLDHDSRITIIHGPNGYGKTTILKLVHAVFSREQDFLRDTPFAELIIGFSDDSSLTLTRKSVDDSHQINYSFKSPTRRNRRHRDQPPDPTDLPRHYYHRLLLLERESPELVRVGATTWRDTATGRLLDMREAVDLFGESLGMPRRLGAEEAFPDWLDEVLDSVSVRLVEAQRLLRMPRQASPRERRRQMAWAETVEAYAQDLASKIKDQLAESAALSQSLDRTFPQRLVESDSGDALREDDLLATMDRVEDHRLRLIEAGLLDQHQEPAFESPGQLSDYHRRVLSVWVKDSEKKLSVYDELARKIELFRHIINQHFRFKEIQIDKDLGFVFRTDDGSSILPRQLSSGEQHELVLAYELLFKVAEGSLVLIDEPELSLHVAWQLRFLQNLLAIVELSPLDTLIATHSPQIINDRWDLTVRLRGPHDDD